MVKASQTHWLMADAAHDLAARHWEPMMQCLVVVGQGKQGGLLREEPSRTSNLDVKSRLFLNAFDEEFGPLCLPFF